MAIVIWTATLAVRKQAYFRNLRRGLLPFLVVWAAVLLPVAAEPDFSTACLIGLLAGFVVFAAGGRIAHFRSRRGPAAIGSVSAPEIRAWTDVTCGRRTGKIGRLYLQ